jgi:sulfur carrier protein
MLTALIKLNKNTLIMKFRLNNNDEIIEKEEISITDLLEYKKYSFKMLVVKVNGEIVKRDDYPATLVKDSDDVLILHLMSGG